MQNPTPELIDLDAYFRRIDYWGDRAPTLETLQAIHRKHPETIVFENLNPFLKLPVLLDLASIQQKLIYEGRGGYCFEQNLLLRSVLIALGYRVTNLAARVMWNLAEGVMTPRSHMLLLVDVEEETFIADVGFGGLTCSAPLSLTLDIEQRTTFESFRLSASEEFYTIEAKIGQNWKPLYRFDFQVQHLSDYEVSNWYTSTHPKSLFTKNLIVARPDAGGKRYALRNNQLAIHHGSHSEQHTLKDVRELRTALEDIFLLELPFNLDPEGILQSLFEEV